MVENSTKHAIFDHMFKVITVETALLFLRLMRVVVLDQVTNQLLQWFEPHPKDGAKLAKSVHIGWTVEAFAVANVLYQFRGEGVAILPERIVVSAVPELTVVLDNLIDFIPIVVGRPDRYSLTQCQPS